MRPHGGGVVSISVVVLRVLNLLTERERCEPGAEAEQYQNKNEQAADWNSHRSQNSRRGQRVNDP